MRSFRIIDYAEATAGDNDNTPDNEVIYQLYRADTAILDTISGVVTSGTLVEGRTEATFFSLQTEDTGVIFLNVVAFSAKGGYTLYDQRPLFIDDPGTLSVSDRTVNFDEIDSDFITISLELAADSALDANDAVYKVYLSDSYVGAEFKIADADVYFQDTGADITDGGIGVITLTGLAPEAFYVGIVTVENANGDILKYSIFETFTEPDEVTPSGVVTGIEIAELSQSFEISFNDENVVEAFGYEVQFSEVGGGSASLHDIGLETSASIAKSAVTAFAQTTTLEMKIRAYADLDGFWSKTIPIKTHTEGLESTVVEITTA